MAWLTECRNALVDGTPIASDPFYPNVILPSVVECTLKAIDDYIWSEIIKAGTTHANWQSNRVPMAPRLTAAQLRPPKFLDLPYDNQLAIVQGMHRVLDPFRATQEEIDEDDRKAAERAEADRKYEAERAANLARDPHFYDNEYSGYD